MKILYATMQFGRGYGQGTERYISILRAGARDHGHDAVVLAGDPERRGHDQPLGTAVDGEAGVIHYPSRGWMSVEGIPPSELRPLLEREAPNLVHVANPAHVGIGLLSAARELGISTVVTIMDYWWVCPKHTLLRADGRICDANVTWRDCVPCIAGGSRRTVPVTLARLPIVRDAALAPLMFLRSLARGMSTPEIGRWQRRQEILLEALDDVNAVICPSRAAQNIVGTRLHRARVHSIPYGLEPQWFRQRGERTRPALRPDPTGGADASRDARSWPHDLVLGYAGALAEHKGVHLLLEAIRRLEWRSTRVRIAGGGDDERYQRRLQRLARGLNVEFAGRIPTEQMPDFLSRLDVLVVPSTWPENLPIIVLEAQALDVPVLGSRVDGIAESIADPMRLFDAGSADSLAKCLSRWAANPGSSEPPTVATAAEMVDRTLEVYLAALSARRQPTAV
jgi:glycosyltransferase involved in cell wall biosynthesis